MKKKIAIVLAGALVAGILGRLAYAQEPANNVEVSFVTNWYHQVSGDEFSNGDIEVDGRRDWHGNLWNEADETEPDVINAELSLSTELTFQYINEEDILTECPPPSYVWSFGDISDESHAWAGLGYHELDPSPADLVTDFNASRTVEPTEFEAAGEQTVTIELTPLQEIPRFHIYIDAWEDDLVNPVIVSPETDEEQGIWLAEDGHWLDIHPTGLDPNPPDPYVYEVIIEVTPKVPVVVYKPQLIIDWGDEIAAGTVPDSDSISLPPGGPMSESGTWAWSATGIYEWSWDEFLCRGVCFEEYRYEPGNKVDTDFDTSWVYDCPGDSFVDTGEEVTGRKEWGANIWNRPDETEAPVGEAELSLDSELDFDWFARENLVAKWPGYYEWGYGDVPQESNARAYVSFGSPDPSPVYFIPEFDASRSAEPNEFAEPGTQTLTVTLTPKVEHNWFHIWVGAREDDWVDPVITDVTGNGIFDYQLSPDGHNLNINIHHLPCGESYTYSITIDVTPKFMPLKFIPEVHVMWGEHVASGTERGDSISYMVEDMGTWTWSAQGEYVWQWRDHIIRKVTFPYYRRPDVVSARFLNVQRYDVSGESFDETVDEVTGRKLWAGIVDNWSGEPINDLALSLASEVVFDLVSQENLIGEPPPYEWSFGDTPHWFGDYSVVGFATPEASPVDFNPGYDATVLVDKTQFSGPAIQTLTIEVIPLEAEKLKLTPTEGLRIYVISDEQELDGVELDPDDLVDAVIISHECDGRFLEIPPTESELGLGDPWIETVKICVTPKVSYPVEYRPSVHVNFWEDLDSGLTEGGSVSGPARDPADLYKDNKNVGTWTVSGLDSYSWLWRDSLCTSLRWAEHCSGVQQESMVGQKLVGPGYFGILTDYIGEGSYEFLTHYHITNPDCGSQISIDRVSLYDSSGHVMYDGQPWSEPMEPHESRFFGIYDFIDMQDDGFMYTIEIFWTWTDGVGLPLAGWEYSSAAIRDDEGNLIEYTHENGTQMINMEQQLQPE